VARILLQDVLRWSLHRTESKNGDKYIWKTYIESIVGDGIL